MNYRQFVSVYSKKCGGGADEAGPIWSRNKEQLQEMTMKEAGEAIRCP